MVTPEARDRLASKDILPIGEYVGVHDTRCWFIPIEKTNKKTKKGKDYWVIKVIDSTFKITSVKCWGIQNDILHLNHLYVAKYIEFNSQWGYSTGPVPPRKNFKLIG